MRRILKLTLNSASRSRSCTEFSATVNCDRKSYTKKLTVGLIKDKPHTERIKFFPVEKLWRKREISEHRKRSSGHSCVQSNVRWASFQVAQTTPSRMKNFQARDRLPSRVLPKCLGFISGPKMKHIIEICTGNVSLQPCHNNLTESGTCDPCARSG